jgi:hypothetical protein
VSSLTRELEQALLDDAFVDRFAEVLAPRLAIRLEKRSPTGGRDPAAAPRLVDAGELARVLGVSRSTVYKHAADLGALEIGVGGRPRLRFDPERALAAWSSRSTSEQSQPADGPAAQGGQRRRSVPRAPGMPPRLPPPGSVLEVKPRTTSS